MSFWLGSLSIFECPSKEWQLSRRPSTFWNLLSIIGGKVHDPFHLAVLYMGDNIVFLFSVAHKMQKMPTPPYFV